MKNKFKIGDIVSWKCHAYEDGTYGSYFIATGVIKKFGKSSFGGIRKLTPSVTIVPFDKYTKMFPKRKTTTIALYNIIDYENTKI